jgi:hypothetical protein
VLSSLLAESTESDASIIPHPIRLSGLLDWLANFLKIPLTWIGVRSLLAESTRAQTPDVNGHEKEVPLPLV